MTNLEHKIKTLNLINWIGNKFEIQMNKLGEPIWLDLKHNKFYTSEQLLKEYKESFEQRIKEIKETL